MFNYQQFAYYGYKLNRWTQSTGETQVKSKVSDHIAEFNNKGWGILLDLPNWFLYNVWIC